MTDRAAGFLEACGSAGPLIVGVDEPGAASPSWRILDRPFAIVGRSPAADLFLGDTAISRRHAYLQVIGGRLFCIDLHSRTGTHWAGEAGVWGWVDPDAGVGIGPFTLRSRGEDAGATTCPQPDAALPLPVSRSFDQPGLAEITLEIVGRKDGPATWKMSRVLALIGTSSACKIRLDRGEVAGIHASLVRTPAGVFAVDLLGPGGILLNGERVGCAPLAPGDEVTVGSHKIRVHQQQSLAKIEAHGRGATALPAPIGAGVEVDLLARALIDEFGRSHERTSGQLQDTLVTVLESIAGMHREQMALIGEELAMIRRLAEERRDSQAQTDQQAVTRPATLRLVSGGLPSRAIPGRGPRDLPRRVVGDGRPVPPTPPAGRPPVRPPSAADDAEFHARVFDRLAEIQGQGQGRWRRLLESILGREAQPPTQPDRRA